MASNKFFGKLRIILSKNPEQDSMVPQGWDNFGTQLRAVKAGFSKGENQRNQASPRLILSMKAESTRCFSSCPVFQKGKRLGGTVICSPVLGLRPL